MAKIMKRKWVWEREKGPVRDYQAAMIPATPVWYTDSLSGQVALTSEVRHLNRYQVSNSSEAPGGKGHS